MTSPRAYIAISGVVFALIFVAHIARIMAEGTGPLREPIFIATSVMSLALTIWAIMVLTRRPSA